MAVTQKDITDWATTQGILKPGQIAEGGVVNAALANNPALNASFAKWQVDKGAITDPGSIEKINAAYAATKAPKPVTEVMSNQVNNPSIPPTAFMTPTTQKVQANELMTGQGSQIQGTQVAQPQAVQGVQLGTAATANAAQVDPNAAIQFLNPATGKYEAVLISDMTPQATAQQGTVSENATVKGQLKQLYEEATPGQIPEWAKGAVTTANEAMAARGMGKSSVGAAAITAAVQQSALPIAAADANTYFQMDIANLSNRQQTELENVRLRQQSLLSDQAATNAASQINAANESQTQQFMASLVTGITTQNADRITTVSTFNATQKNEWEKAQAALDDGILKFNAEMKNQIDTFNASLDLQRQQFNATNAFAVEQSNVLWRRSVNTANTAAINASNQTNVQNAFNLSTSALNNIWQQFRDEASWLFTASENQKNRDFQLTYLANQQQFVRGENDADLGAAIGSLATNWLLS